MRANCKIFGVKVVTIGKDRWDEFRPTMCRLWPSKRATGSRTLRWGGWQPSGYHNLCKIGISECNRGTPCGRFHGILPLQIPSQCWQPIGKSKNFHNWALTSKQTDDKQQSSYIPVWILLDGSIHKIAETNLTQEISWDRKKPESYMIYHVKAYVPKTVGNNIRKVKNWPTGFGGQKLTHWSWRSKIAPLTLENPTFFREKWFWEICFCSSLGR